jgi:hypothetical protein
MPNLRNLRDLGLVLGGVLAGAWLFSVPNQASSAYREGNAIMGAIIIEKDKRDRREHQPNNPEGWGGITRSSSYYRPMSVSSQLFPNHEDCGAVKLDVWLNRGQLIYSLFNPDTEAASLFNLEADASTAESTDVPGKTTMLIGGKNCRIRVVIERADDSSGGN